MAMLAGVTTPVSALPLDVFRVAVGLLSVAYFARTWLEAPLFSGPDGLLDHALVRRMLPFARMTLIPARASLGGIRAAYAGGCVAGALLALGIEPRAAAVVLYLLAVSTYRWNLLLMYVDDAIVHLALFWMIVLPIGTTLTLPGYVADPDGAWAAWQGAVIPGLGVRAFLANLALVYLVAGLWKWTSPLWRHGWAVYVVLRMAVSYRPDAWRPTPRTLVRMATWFALVIEPALSLLLVLPAGSPAKWLLLGGAVAFHGGIIVTMRFPFANLAMLAAMVVFFGPEMMGALGVPPTTVPGLTASPGEWLGVAVVTCLALLFLCNAAWYARPPTLAWAALRRGRPAINPFYVPLWLVGLAQSYRLFDWIDERNLRVTYRVCEIRTGTPPVDVEVDEHTLFPRSMRHILLHSYLHGNLWVRLDPACLAELRAGILTAYARRYCRLRPDAWRVEVQATVCRITEDNLDLRRGVRVQLMAFVNEGGEPRMLDMNLAPPAYT